MRNILFLTDRKACHLALPLLKWRRWLLKEGLRVQVSCNAADISSKQWDDVILTEPLYRAKFRGNTEFFANGAPLIRKDIKSARDGGASVIFFEARDGTSSPWFELLPEVDQYWKKQLLVDRDYYCTLAYRDKPSIWVEAEQTKRQPAEAQYIDKLKVGWNIAYHPYGWPQKGSWLPLWYGLVASPHFTDSSATKELLTAFRGRLAGNRKGHRQATIDALVSMKHPRIITGGVVSKRQYNQEVRNSQVVVSPFGYGEPCFRDMEAFMAGAALLKPAMGHLETFPDLYKPEGTYVEYAWDSSNLPGILLELESEPERMQRIASEGQKTFKKHWTDANLFVSHFAKVLMRCP